MQAPVTAEQFCWSQARLKYPGCPRGMFGNACQATPPRQNNATVLESAVRIPKPRPDRADFGPGRVADHFSEPPGILDFGVVVQEHQNFTASLRDRLIVEAAVVEWPALHDDAGDLFALHVYLMKADGAGMSPFAPNG
jgi:hypothetical protein